MNTLKIINILTLWWASTWRLGLISFAIIILIVSLGFDIEQASNVEVGRWITPSILIALSLSGITLINNPIGKRRILVTLKTKDGTLQVDKASLIDGLTIQWALFWRYQISIIFLTVMFNTTEVVLFGTGSFSLFIVYLFSVLTCSIGSTFFLLKKVFGKRVFTVILSKPKRSLMARSIITFALIVFFIILIFLPIYLPTH
jgi:hypothetical protein